MKLKRYENALTEVDQVLSRLDTSNTKALYRKAQILEAVGRYDEALESIQTYFSKGLIGDDSNAKSFNQLKSAINKKVEVGNRQSKELAQKMVQQPT